MPFCLGRRRRGGMFQRGVSLDYVTSSGRTLDFCPPLLRRGGGQKKKEAFSLLRLSLSIWTNGKHAHGLLNASPLPHLLSSSLSVHTHTLTNRTTAAAPPLAAGRRGDSLIRSSIVAVNSGFPEHLDRQVTAGSELPLSL